MKVGDKVQLRKTENINYWQYFKITHEQIYEIIEMPNSRNMLLTDNNCYFNPEYFEVIK